MVKISLSASPAWGPRFLAGWASWLSSRASQCGPKAWQKSSNWQKSSTSRSNMDASPHLMAPTQKEEFKGDKGLASPQTRNSGSLPDSHKSSQGPAMAHCFELVVTGQYDDGSGLSIITGPAAEADADPASVGQSAPGMRVLLLGGFALKCLADGLQGGQVGRLEDILQRAFVHPVAVAQHLDRGDQNGDGEVFERASAIRTASTSKPLVFITRNRCSMVQRWA